VADLVSLGAFWDCAWDFLRSVDGSGLGSRYLLGLIICVVALSFFVCVEFTCLR